MPGAARILLALMALAVACKGPIPAVAGEPDTTKVCEMECPSFLKNKLPSSILQSYTISNCKAKKSIILRTKKNRIFCAHPDHDWVKKAMQDIDARTKHGTTTENLPAANRHSGEAKLEIGDKAQPTKKVSTTTDKTATSPVRTTADPQPFVERGLAGLEATTSSSSLTPPQPETIAEKATLPPDPIADHEAGSETSEEHKRLGEHFTPTKEGLEDFSRTTQQLASPPPMPFPGTGKTSTQSPAFVSETLASPSARPSTNSSVRKLPLEFVTKDKTSITIPTKLSNSSELFLSSFSTGHKPTSVEGATTQLPTNSRRPSSTPWFGSGRTSLHPVQFQGVTDAEGEGDTTQTPLSIGTGRTFSKHSDTLANPGYHQETFSESASISNPNTSLPTFDCFPHPQPMVQNYIIPILSIGGVLCVFLAVGGLIYLKCNICTKRSSKRQVQGLLYYPCDSQAETYPMESV